MGANRNADVRISFMTTQFKKEKKRKQEKKKARSNGIYQLQKNPFSTLGLNFP